MRGDSKTDRRRLANPNRKAFMMLAAATSCKEAQDAKKNGGTGALLNTFLAWSVLNLVCPLLGFSGVTSRHSAANFLMCAYIP
jgi:hypothetical protein